MRRIVKKISVLGYSGTGKKSILNIIAPFDKTFEKYTDIIGTAITKYVICFKYKDEDFVFPILVWDITGKISSKKLRDAYLTGTEGFVIVADASRFSTILSIPIWLEYGYSQIGKVPVSAIINKMDLVSENEVEKIKKEVEKIKQLPIFYTSIYKSKKEELEMPFLKVAKALIEKFRFSSQQ